MSNDIAIYDFQDYLLNTIAPKYFKVEDSNLLRVGMLGYVNELFSSNMESNAFRMSELADEFLPNTAKLKSSIYRYASFVKYENLYATPAKAPIAIVLKEDDILKVSEVYTNRREFILDKYMTIRIGEYPFMLPYDVRVTVTDTLNGINYLGEYIIDDDNPNNINPYIPIQAIQSDEYSGRYVYIMMECRQVERSRFEEYLGANSEVERMKFNFEFNGDMSDFKIYYSEPGSDKYIILDKVLEHGVASDNKFCYYYYEHDEQYNSSKLTISFSDKIGHFIPERGSRLVMDVYTTQGNSGNFNYRGKSTNVIVSDSRFNYEGVVFNTNILGDSVGGKDSKSLTEISEDVTSSMLTINSINTDTDLNFFFRTHYNSEINFVKKREDVLRRVYTAFSKLTSKDMLISSNTLSLVFNSMDIDPGSMIKTIRSSQSMIYSDDNTTTRTKIRSLGDEVKDFEYFNPFTHVVDIESYSTKTYLPSISNYSRIVPKYTNRNTPVHPMSNEIYILRDALLSDEYVISFEVLVTDTGYLSDNMKVYLSLAGYYIKMDIVDMTLETIKFECRLKTNDKFDSESRIRIVNSLRYENELIPDCGIPISNVDMGIYFFLPKGVLAHEIESDEFTHTFKDELDLKDHNLAVMYGRVDPFNIALDLSDIVRPVVSYDVVGGGDGYSIELKGIPLLKMDYKRDPEILMDIYKKIYRYDTNIRSFRHLLDNHEIALKFINTHGRTNVFRYQNGQLMESNNITIRFNVSLHSYVGVDLEDLKYKIQMYVTKYVENLNLEDPTSYNIYISNLIRFLERDFTRIKYLEFLGINKTGPETQVIEFKEIPFDELEYDVIDDNVPEYLNVGYTYHEDRNFYEPNVEITFK